MLRKHPDQYTDDELRDWVAHLVNDQVEEGPTLDYKEIQSLDQPKRDRREVAKDVSSFANESGGTVLYGIAEDRASGGPAIPKRPYGMAPIPNFETRVEDILVEAISPRLAEYRIRSVPVPGHSVKVVYCVWTPESWAGVHMVQAYEDQRFYRRGQYRAVPMNEREVRERYERVVQRRNLIDEFLASSRVNHVAARLPFTYRSHYVCCPMITSESRIDFAMPDVQEWLERNRYDGSQYQSFVSGVRTELIVKDPQWWRPYVEIHSNGAISVWRPADISNVGVGPDVDVLAYLRELNQILKFLRYTGRWLSFARYTGPVRLLVEISHHNPAVLMGRLRFPHRIDWPDEWPTLFSHREALSLDVEESAMVVISEPNRALKKLADALFRAFGRWEADCFDEHLNLLDRGR